MAEMAVFWVFIAVINGAIGAALGSLVDKGSMGALLGFFLGPLGWIIVFLLPREAKAPQIDAKPTTNIKWADLSDDRYKVWLGKEYKIEKNDLFEKYECDGNLFDTLDQALEFADKNFRRKSESKSESAKYEAPPEVVEAGQFELKIIITLSIGAMLIAAYAVATA